MSDVLVAVTPGIHISDPTARRLIGLCGADGAFGSPPFATCPTCLTRYARRDALVLAIPRVLHSANIGRGRHWASRHKDTKLWEGAIWIAALQAPGGRAWLLDPARQERRRVTITRHMPRNDVDRMDPDNLIFAAKGVRDALKRLRLITDDSRKWLESRVENAHTPGAPAHTTITIERLKENA